MSQPLTSGHIGAANYAFFPMFPLLIKGINFIFGLNPILIGIVLNNIIYYFFIVLVLKYHRDNFPLLNQKTLAYILSFSPIGIYVNSLYTESLFLLLVILVVVCLEQNRWIIVGLIGIALSATRFVGVFVVLLPLLKIVTDRKIPREKSTQKIASITLFPLGLVMFMFFLKSKTGDYLAFKNIQKAWGFGDLSFLDWIQRVFYSNSITQWGYLITLLIAILLSAYFFNMGKYNESLILIIPFIVSVVSVAINFRYFYALYPYATFLCILLYKYRFLRIPILIVAPIVSILVELAWIQGAGYLV